LVLAVSAANSATIVVFPIGFESERHDGTVGINRGYIRDIEAIICWHYNSSRLPYPVAAIAAKGLFAYSDGIAAFAGACFAPNGRTMFVNIYDPGLTLTVWGDWKKSD
jgi:secreted PhoX family phosphatase